MQSKVTQIADTLIGTPWHFQGRAPQVGMDCAGVLWYVGKELGVSEKEQSNSYSFALRGDALITQLKTYLDEIPVTSAGVGDILVFCLHAGIPQHTAILVDGGKMVHAVYGRGVVKAQYDIRWRTMAHTAFRYRLGDI